MMLVDSPVSTRLPVKDLERAKRFYLENEAILRVRQDSNLRPPA